MNRFPLKKIYSVFIVVLFVSGVFAQDTRRLKIFVEDQNGDKILSYSVLLTNSSVHSEKRVTNGESVVFDSLRKQQYRLRVSAPGFKTFEKDIDLVGKVKQIAVTLEINEVKENVNVELTGRLKRFEDSISKIYTEKEIEALPNDPRSIEKELKRKYGNNVRFQVDGFFGGQIPDKSRIAAIKVIYDPVDAEFHFAGDPIVQITTRPGGKKWNGYFSTTLGNSFLNARNAFESQKLNSGNNAISGSLTPPAFSEDTSLSFSFNTSRTTKENSFIGVVPENNIEGDRLSSTSIAGISTNVYQNITEDQVGFFRYSFLSTRSTGVGLGPLDLSERSATLSTRNHNFRYSQTGVIGENTNHFRAEFLLRQYKTVPFQNAPAINILDTANFGGSPSDSDGNSWTLAVADNLTFSHKRHLLKIGFENSFEMLQRETRDNVNGTFIFSSLSDFRNQSSLLFSIRQSTASTKVSDIKFAGFIQDYVRFSEYFQVGIGLRYEWQKTIGDFDNFSPRVSFAWSPEKSGKFIVRAAVGVLYRWLETSEFMRIRSDSMGTSNIIAYAPGYPIPFSSGQIASRNITETTRQLSTDVKNPQRFYTLLSPSYSFNRATKVTVGIGYARTNNDFISLIKNSAVANEVGTISGRLIQTESVASTTEKNLVVGLTAKIKSFPLEASYLYSKTSNISDSILSVPSDSDRFELDYGRSASLSAHNMNFSMQGSLGELIDPRLKSLYFSLGVRAASGLPYSITTGQDDNGDLEVSDRPFGISRNSLRGDWSIETNASLRWQISKFDQALQKFFLPSGRASFNVSISNLFNNVNRKGFIGVQTSPFFRQPTFAGAPRTVLFGLDYSF